MRELPTSKILVQVLAAEEHLVDIAGAWDVPGRGAYLFQFSAFRKHTMKIYGTMQVASCHVEASRVREFFKTAFVPKAICNGKVSDGIYVRPRIG